MFFINNLIFCFLLSFIGLLDVSIWTIVLIHPGNIVVSPIVFLSVRGVFSIILFLLVKYKLKHESAMFLGLFTSIIFYFLGIIGLSGMYFVFNTVAEPSAQKASLYHIDKEEGEETPDSIVSDQPISIRFDELYEVAPLADGMTDDDTVIRVAAISAIEETDSTQLFSVISDSRKDTAKEVQYFAHEALKKVSDAYMKKIKELIDDINKSGSSYETFKELADLYADLAHKNIEHPILVRFYRQEAIKYYSDLLKNYQQHRNAILEGLIPVLYENGDYKECIKYSEELYQDPELSSKSIEFKARCLFKMRDIRTLEQFIQNQKNSNLVSINNFIELSEYGLNDG
jgi:hypothetical protein